MRPRGRRDKNQGEVVAALRAAGASVIDLAGVGGGVPDLLVGCTLACPDCWRHLRANLLVEVKNLAGRGEGLTLAETAFHARWGGQVAIVRSAGEALALIERMGV